MNLPIDENVSADGKGALRCSRCETELGSAGDDSYLSKATWRESPATDAPASVMRADPSEFVDREVVLRQAICPGCLTLLLTEIVPADEPHYRVKRLSV